MAESNKPRAQNSRRKSLFRNHSGAVAVEFALVGPVLFFILFAIVEVGRGFFTLSTLRLAVEDAARQMAVKPVSVCSSGSDLTYTSTNWATVTDFETTIEGRAGLALSASQVSNLTITLVAPASQPAGLGDSGCLIEVKVTYPFSWILPGIPVLLGGSANAGTQTMTASTRMIAPMS